MDYYTDKDITVNEHNIIKCVLRQIHYLQKLKREKGPKNSSSLGSRKEIRSENYKKLFLKFTIFWSLVFGKFENIYCIKI